MPPRPQATARTRSLLAALFLWLTLGALALAMLASLSGGEANCASHPSVLSDPDYREGFGKDATGGEGLPICTVTSGAAFGVGTLDACFQPGDTARNKTIVFSVDSVTLPGNRYIGSNVTIDGCAGGMNGVTVDQTADAKRGLVVSGGSSNIVIRCLNLRGTGIPASGAAEFDNLALDGDSPTPISHVFIDRLTSMQASDGALDITGNVSHVTVQRSLFYGNAITMLVKYDTRQNISIHHNVFTRNGERNPQVKGDMRLLDFVNNVVHLNDVPSYPDGSDTSPYGTRILSCGPGCDSPGNVVANFVNNAYVGSGAQVLLETGPGGGSNAGVHLAGNYCSPASHCPTSPRGTPNDVPAAYAVTALATDQLKAQLLPSVGSPNRTVLDQQRIDDVAAVLPGSPAPDPQPPSVPAGLRATAAPASEINLSWTTSTDDLAVTGYEVCRGGARIATSATTTYQNTGLSPSTRYTYTVSAYDAAGNASGQSASASATTQAGGGDPLIPADRTTTWNPGLNSVGGIPNRTTICATVNASTYGNGTQNAADGIQAAIDSCPAGQVVQLSAGTFRIANRVLVNKAITLRGQEPAQTKLKMPWGINDNLITIGAIQWTTPAQTVNFASNGVKGTQSVTLAGNPGLTVGEIVIVDQLTDSNLTYWGAGCPSPNNSCRTWYTRPNRPLGQIMEIGSVSGNTITLTTPFHIDFTTAQTAQLSRIIDSSNNEVVPMVKYAGVEDLYMSGGSAGGQGNIKMEGAAYSWIKNVESDDHGGHSIGLYKTFRSVVRDSYVHSAHESVPGGGAYGIAVSFYSSDNLVENNVVMRMNKVMVMQASGGGNVIAYNYMDDGMIEYQLAWMESGINASHMAGSHMELFEGNQSFNFDAENTWGSPIYISAFRNHLTGKRRSTPPRELLHGPNDFPYDQYRRAVSLSAGAWWFTFVGNVLGYSGMSAAPSGSFVYEDFYPWTDDPVSMWKIGLGEDWGPADPKVVSTLIRDGNFDYVTTQVRWDRTAQPIPDSLYLAGKPAFFGSNTWPWVDATGATKVHTLPARHCHDQGLMPTCFQSGGGDTTPPTVALTAPAGGATVSGAVVTVSATASDNVGVVGVQFTLDGAALGAEVTAPPYAISWNSTLVADGTHALTAVARDGAGNTATATAVRVVVHNAPPPVALTVSRAGSAEGTVSSSPAGLSCGATCSVSLPPGTLVTLTATAAPGALFREWRGLCAGTSPTCLFTLSAPTTLTAVFAQRFTDEPLLARSSLVASGHVMELRSAIDTLRARGGLAPFAYTDPGLSRGSPIRAVHLSELRTALTVAYQAAGRPGPTYTDPVLSPGQTPIRAVHVQELRAGVRGLE